MTTKADELLALAKKATPGEWEAVLWGDHVRIQAKSPASMGMIVGRTYGNSLGDQMDAAYIAATNPSAIIALIESHKAEVERLARERDEARKDDTASTGETMKRWYLGSMNDGLFIIDTPPRPSTDHINPNVGPDMVLNVTDLPHTKAEAIVAAHNAEVEKYGKTYDCGECGKEIVVDVTR